MRKASISAALVLAAGALAGWQALPSLALEAYAASGTNFSATPLLQ